MRGKFEFKEGYTYHMPVHFRGTPAGEVMNPLYGDVFVLSADLTTEMEALAQFVPKDFEILEPVVNVQYNDCRSVDWMSHGEYRILKFAVPVRYLGNDEGLTGLYPLVLWEDKTEPILTGREDTGMPKMFADISIERRWEDHWFVRASYEGTTFVKLDFWDKEAAGADEIAAGNEATHRVNDFGWRYIPNVRGGGAALSHAVLYPSEAHMDTIWHGEATLTWTPYDWWENIIQAPIIRGVSSLPILGVGNATRSRGRCILVNSEARVLPLKERKPEAVDTRAFYANKVAVVTGGASGIGLALTELMLGFGATVIMADINETKLHTEADRLSAQHPGRIFAKRTDISKADEVEALVDYGVAKGGRLDFMFNNAGLPLTKPIDEITMNDWKFAFDVNFYGALYGTLAARRVMRAQGGGHIANTASGIAFAPMPLQAMYSATKAALHGLTLALRAECWDENIFLHSVIPGTVATPIWAGGEVPEGAFTPEASARAILERVKDNMRIVFVDPLDMEGAKTSNHPDLQPYMDEYFNRVAAARKAGNTSAL